MDHRGISREWPKNFPEQNPIRQKNQQGEGGRGGPALVGSWITSGAYDCLGHTRPEELTTSPI